MTKITLTGEQVEALKAVMAKLSNAADSWLEIGQNDGPEAADIYQDLYYGWMELAGHFEQQAKDLANELEAAKACIMTKSRMMMRQNRRLGE